MKRRLGIYLFNIVLAMGVAALYLWALSGKEFSVDTIAEALKVAGWAGFVVGATVGFGAVMGSRPVLPAKKCVVAQLMVVVTSAIGAWIGSFFPGEIQQVEEAMKGYLQSKGIIIGSGIGAIVGTVVQVLDVYRQRRKAAHRQERKSR